MAVVIHQTATKMQHVLITEAGLMDPTTITYSPGLLIEYNYNLIDYIEISNCKATGIEIRRVDPFSTARITHANITNNIGSGIVTRSPYLRVEYSSFTNNLMSGFEYNPFFSADDGRLFRNAIHNPTDLKTVSEIVLKTTELKFYTSTQDSKDQVWSKEIAIRVPVNEKVVIDVLDYNPDTTQENVTIVDSEPGAITEQTYRWGIEDDLVDFPVVSSSNVVTLRWRVTGKISGRLTFSMRASKSWTQFLHRHTHKHPN